jgi:rhamnogalacturonan hydrolase
VISNVVYQKVYTVNSNQMMVIKASGGSRYVRDIPFNGFIGYGNASSLNRDQNWGKQTLGSGDGD